MRVAVLGAGVVGTAAAWYLAEDGHDVTLVDRHPHPGRETSFANGGQIAAGHAEPWASPAVLPKVLRWLGREDAPLLFRPRADLRQWRWALGFAFECLPGRFERNTRQLAGLARYSRDCLAALRAATGIEYHRVARGILHFCTRQQDFDTLAAHARRMAGLGLRREVTDAAQCLAIEPALGAARTPVVGGIYAPEDESGDAYEFTERLARLAQSRGVRFLGGTAVEALEAAGDRVAAARTRTGRIEADRFVIALGSYSPLLLAPLGVSIPVYPLKGYSVTLELQGGQAQVAPSVSLTDEAHKIVMSRFGERLRCAGTAELTGYDTSINERRCQSIVRRLRELFPQLEGGKEIACWSGLRPATPNNVPVIGRTRYANLFLDTGHGTLGWTLAAGSGRAVADLVAGRRPQVDFAFVNP